jgi:hypothetical protein
MRSFQRRIRRTRKGDFLLQLPPHERDVLRSLPGQLRELLARDDPALVRLFPPAYPEDPSRNAEYEEMVKGDLTARRRRSLEVMEASLDAERVDEEQLLEWVGALNDLRLVLGTRLDVTEDVAAGAISDQDPRAPIYALYFYLGWLQEQAVEALSAPGQDG